MRYLISAMLVVVGIIHLLPLSGVLGSKQLGILYVVTMDDPNLIILMRHRAAFFGLLGMFFLFAAFQRAFQALAFVAGFISVISFLVIAWTSSDYNEQIARVVMADIVALVCLAIGSAAHLHLHVRDQLGTIRTHSISTY
jgi:hypothetical protein